MTNDEVKQERSIPVASRVDMVDLANLALMWESRGYTIRSMSQLVSWSISLLVDELSKADIFKEKIETLADANKVLAYRGLYQRSMKSRSEKKIGIALGFEALRAEGRDPKEYAEGAYKTMHPDNQVKTHRTPFGDVVTAQTVAQLFEEAKLKKQQEEAEKRKAIRDAKEAGTVVHEGMSPEEFEAQRQAVDKQQMKELDEAEKSVREQLRKE